MNKSITIIFTGINVLIFLMVLPTKNLLLRGFNDGWCAPLNQSACDHGQRNLVEILSKLEVYYTFK